MSKFKKIIIDKKRGFFLNVKYLPQVIMLYSRYSKFLNDDYFLQQNLSPTDAIIKIIENTAPYFWIVLKDKDEKFAGFVFLDNLTGSAKNLHSAEVTTCFSPEFWGKYTKNCAKKFLKYCFRKFRLKKIKACIFPQNHRVRMLLKKSGFKREAILRGETLREGNLQDIEVFAITNDRYLFYNKKENEVKNEI